MATSIHWLAAPGRRLGVILQSFTVAVQPRIGNLKLILRCCIFDYNLWIDTVLASGALDHLTKMIILFGSMSRQPSYLLQKKSSCLSYVQSLAVAPWNQASPNTGALLMPLALSMMLPTKESLWQMKDAGDPSPHYHICNKKDWVLCQLTFKMKSPNWWTTCRANGMTNLSDPAPLGDASFMLRHQKVNRLLTGGLATLQLHTTSNQLALLPPPLEQSLRHRHRLLLQSDLTPPQVSGLA